MKHGGVLLLCTMIFTSVVSVIIQLDYRQQARYNLEQVRTCLNSTNPYITVNKAFDVCTSKSRTTTTGDIYILNGETLEFVHENSNDVPKQLYFTKDSVGQYFKDWNSAKKALVYLTSGKDSDSSYSTGYNFDGDTEWLEWINYVHDNKWYIIVQGIQKDEALRLYTYITYIMYIGSFLIAISCIALENRECTGCHLVKKA